MNRLLRQELICLLSTSYSIKVSVPDNMSKRKAECSDNVVSKKGSGHWSLGLLSSMEDPNLQVQSDDKLVVIKDMYPKAEYHYLVLPREKIASLKDVNRGHLDLLQHMHDTGMKIAEKHPSHNFRLGYHAEPSMHHLHLHVISDDFNSVCLKTKKHWNSFTTDHFIPSSKILSSLKDTGKPCYISREKCKELLNSDLKCHKCTFRPKNMPNLKEHLLKHLPK